MISPVISQMTSKQFSLMLDSATHLTIKTLKDTASGQVKYIYISEQKKSSKFYGNSDTSLCFFLLYIFILIKWT